MNRTAFDIETSNLDFSDPKAIDDYFFHQQHNSKAMREMQNFDFSKSDREPEPSAWLKSWFDSAIRKIKGKNNTDQPKRHYLPRMG